jgi:Tol biopolymer transport system component
MVGQTLGHYRIVREIGAGGMGIVYQAEDITLTRQVALKILPPELAADPDRRSRFAREARAVAALNHPNIVTVHSVEEAGGVHFITMELVKGVTLADALPHQGLGIGRFFEIAIPLSDAVATAHQHGITHRDLKPANVMIADDGRVKVLDFGLAKSMETDRAGNLSTLTATAVGQTVGTPAYMSPEQAQGAPVDARSDIFSLGIVLYEMLTGRRPFDGSNPASIISAILRDTPSPITEQRPAVPRAVSRLVDRCLAKNPVDRFQSALDLRHRLEEVQQEVDSGEAFPAAPAARQRRAKPGAAALAGVTALVAAAVAAWLAFGRDDAIPPAGVRNAVQVTSALDVESYPTWSPDGQRLAYQAAERLMAAEVHDIWIVQLGSGEPVNLTKDSPADDQRPSWSPDGREIAFVSDRDGDRGVFIVPALGGNPRKVLAMPGAVGGVWSAPQWAPDGTRLFVAANYSNRNAVLIVRLDTLETSRIELPTHDSPRCWDLTVRADGRRFAYLEAGAGNPELSRLWTIDVSGGEPVPLTDGRTSVWSPSWSRDGLTLFYVSNRGGSWDLWQQQVTDDGRPAGEPVPVTAGLGVRSVAVTADGTRLAYSQGGTVSSVLRAPILEDRPAVWNDVSLVTSGRTHIEMVDISPDAQQLVVSSDRRGNQDLWVLPAGGGEMTPLTTDPTPDWNPRWSPDGGEIVFYGYRSGNRDIWVMPARGGPARQLTTDPAFDWFPSWSPDSREIAFVSQRGGGQAVWIVAAGGGEARRLTQGAAPDWSPDGEWLVVVREGRLFRVPRDGGEPVQLSDGRHQAQTPRVSRDGRSVFYSVVVGPREQQDLWRLSLADGAISRLTQLEGRRGRIGYYYVADASNLYFTWSEHDGDIWVADLVADDNR